MIVTSSRRPLTRRKEIRHEGTRTRDLYRVKSSTIAFTITYIDQQGLLTTCKYV